METEPGVINMALWLLSRRRQMEFWHWICKIYLKTQMSWRITSRQKKGGREVAPIVCMACFLFLMFSKDSFTSGRTQCFLFVSIVVFCTAYSQRIHWLFIFAELAFSDGEVEAQGRELTCLLVDLLKPEPFSWLPFTQFSFLFSVSVSLWAHKLCPN